jgi:hypothetical protein
VGYISRKRGIRNEYKILVRKLEGKRPFGRPLNGREDKY